MTRLRMALLGVIVTLAVVLFSLVKCQGNRVERAEGRAVVAEATATTATAQSELTTETAKIADRRVSRERAIDTIAKEATDELQDAPGGDALVPPDVRDRWAAGIDRLRDEADAAYARRAADPGL